MTLLEERLNRDLQEIARRATVSPDAWEAIVDRLPPSIESTAAVATDVEVVELRPALSTAGVAHSGRRWRVLAVAAAVLGAVLVAGLVVLNAGDDLDEPVVTDSPDQPDASEQGLADLSPADGLEFVNALVARLNGRGAAEAAPTLHPEAVVDYWAAKSAEEIPALDSHMAARGLVITTEDCVELPDVADSGAFVGATRFECPASLVEDVTLAKGLDPYPALVDVWTLEDQVVLLRLDWDRWERYENEMASFWVWLDENYPAWGAEMLTQQGFPSSSAESNAFWEARVDEYIAEELE